MVKNIGVIPPLFSASRFTLNSMRSFSISKFLSNTAIWAQLRFIFTKSVELTANGFYSSICQASLSLPSLTNLINSWDPNFDFYLSLNFWWFWSVVHDLIYTISNANNVHGKESIKTLPSSVLHINDITMTSIAVKEWP